MMNEIICPWDNCKGVLELRFSTTTLMAGFGLDPNTITETFHCPLCSRVLTRSYHWTSSKEVGGVCETITSR